MEKIVTQRVRDFIESQKMSIRAFAYNIGMLQETLNKQLNENGKGVSTRTIVLILKAYPELSAEWLMRGEGEMERKPHEKTAKELIKDSEFLIEKMKKQIEWMEKDKERTEKMLDMTLGKLEENKREKTQRVVEYDSVAAE